MRILNELDDEVSGIALLLIAMIVGTIMIVGIPLSSAQVENMTITGNPVSVNVGVPTNIKFTVTSINCTAPSGEACTQTIEYVSGASVQISGAGTSGSNTTNDMGEAVINVIANSPEDITATASKDGSSASIIIKAYALPQLVITADPSTVYAGISRDVNFTVTQNCPQGTDVCTQGSLVSGATVKLTGAFSGEATTTGGKAVITINANSAGTITATAGKAGYTNGSTTITVKGQPQLNLTANVEYLFVNVSRNVTFTVNHICGSASGDRCSADSTQLIPDGGVKITLGGVASGSGETVFDAMAQIAKVTIPVNATSPGNVTVTASKEGYIDDVLNIPADYLPAAVFTSNRSVYITGDIVKLTLTNIGHVAIIPDRWWVKNTSKFQPVYSSLLEDNVLLPGNSIEYTWNQTDNNKNQVPPWEYKAGISYSYHNNSFSNYTNTFRINPCAKIVEATKTLNSTVGQNVKFSSRDLIETGKVWNVTWYINGTEVFKETGVTQISNYTNNNTAAGVWNVTVVAESGCNTIVQKWEWTVTRPPNCFNYANDPEKFESYLGYAVKFPSGNLTSLNKTWNFTWYINGTEVFSETNGGQSNYTNRSASLGTWNVTVIAKSDCSRDSWTWIWTVKKEPSLPCSNCGGGSSGGGSSSGGGGGGGLTTSEPFTNVLKFERQDASIKRGSPVTYSFSSPVFAIYQVDVVGKENEGEVGMRVEHLKDTSALVNRIPSGIIYAHENVWLGSKRIEYVVLRFRVTNSWIAENKLDKTDISLLRFDNGWKKLNTKEIKSDSTYTYFEAKTPGLSSFAVSGLKDDAGGQDSLAQGDTSISDGGNHTETTNETSAGKKSSGIGIVAVFGVISVSYLLWIRRRK